MAITPYLLYQDAGAALTWLAKAFGLRKTGQAFKDANGRVTHAEMALGDAVLLLGSPGPDFKNPKVLGQATQNLYVDVDDVDEAPCACRKAGAKIIEAPQDTVLRRTPLRRRGSRRTSLVLRAGPDRVSGDRREEDYASKITTAARRRTLRGRGRSSRK